MRKVVIAACLMGITSVSHVAFADINQWTGIGPEGGDVMSLALLPSTPPALFAGINGGGAYKSVSGDAWQSVNNGIPSRTMVTVFGIDPTSTTTMYAGTQSGIYKSTDSGNQWVFAATLPTAWGNGNLTKIVVDRSNPLTVYATNPTGVHKSTDGGFHWTEANTGIDFEPSGSDYSVVDLAVDPVDTSVLYAVVSQSGLFRSADHGASWARATLDPQLYVSSVAVRPDAPGVVYAETNAGIYRSSDNGATWMLLAGSPAGYGKILVDHSILYVNTGSSIYRSANGSDWETLNTAPMGYIASLAVDPSNPATLFVGTNYGGGVYKSVNGGQDWVPANAGLHGTSVQTFALDPGSTDVYAGLYGGGVFKSCQNGTWSKLSGLPVNAVVNALVPGLNDSGLLAGTYDGIYKTVDGSSWSAANSGLPPGYTADNIRAFVSDPRTSTIFAGTEGGIFRSINGGETWTDDNPNYSVPYRAITNLTIDNSGIIYGVGWAGYDDQGSIEAGVYRRDQNGSWSLILFSDYARDVAVSATGTDVFAALYNGGVRKSVGGGAWTTVNNGLTDLRTYAIAVDPTNPATVYVGTEGSGVFRTTNGGQNWSPFNAGIDHPIIHTLAVDATGTSVYAGSVGGGAYKITLGTDLTVTPVSNDFGNVEVGNTSEPRSFTLTNSGAVNLVVTSLAAAGNDSTMFNVVSDTCSSSKYLPPGQSCTISVTFAPSTLGSKSMQFQIAYNSTAGSPISIPLSGTAVDTVPPVIIATDPAPGEVVPIGKSLVLTFSENLRPGTAFGGISLLKLRNNNNPLEIAVTVTIAGNTMTIDPVLDLPNNASYEVVLPANSVTDIAGNAFAEYHFQFSSEK